MVFLLFVGSPPTLAAVGVDGQEGHWHFAGAVFWYPVGVA
jgi:hypothetical protein